MAAQEWKEENVRIAGIEMPVIRGGSGKPLLVLHDELGWAGWLEWCRALARDHTLIIPMAPGFSRAPRVGWVESVRDVACIYGQLIRDLKLDIPDVLGFSFGGWLAAEMIANNPHQFRRSILVGPGGVRPPAGQGEIMDLFQVPADVYLNATMRDPQKTSEYGVLYGGASPERYEAFEDARAEFARIGWQPYFHNPSLPYLLECAGPQQALIIWGRDDRVIPKGAVERYQKSIAGSKLVALENCGHRPEIEKTQEFVSQVQKFLA